jgi:hypothetical protein
MSNHLSYLNALALIFFWSKHDHGLLYYVEEQPLKLVSKLMISKRNA